VLFLSGSHANKTNTPQWLISVLTKHQPSRIGATRNADPAKRINIMSYQPYLPGPHLAHRWSMMAATELLPAVNDGGKLPRTESLRGLPWTGETPTLVSGRGVVRRLLGHGEYMASGSEVRQWFDEGHNLLLQHRWLRGIRIEGSTMAIAQQRWSDLRTECEDFLGHAFEPPVVGCWPTPGNWACSVTAIVEVDTPWLATRQARGAALLGSGSLTLVHGSNGAGKPVSLSDNHEAWGPPKVSSLYLHAIWQSLTGERISETAVGDTAMQHMGLLIDDPLAGVLDRNGWVLGANPRGLTLRCPYHPRAHTPALYEPTGSGRRKPRISCPHCPRSRKLGDYLAMMGLAEEAASI
jgi:hypothetical protein